MSSGKPMHGSGNVHRRGRKQNRPFSAGTVSGVIGKDYTNCNTPSSKNWVETKPIKISEEPISVFESKKESLSNEMEELVVNMLSGFELDKDDMERVLGQSGYQLEKNMGNHSVEEPDMKNPNAASSSYKNEDRIIENAIEIERKNIQSSVLASLFEGTVEKTRASRAPLQQKTRSLALGKLVVSAQELDSDEERPSPVILEEENDTVLKLDDEDPYVLTLKAAEEYRFAMAEYYKAAIQAAKKEDFERSNMLISQGDFFSKKAHEADKESTDSILSKCNDSQLDNDFLLDLHSCGPSESVRLIKSHIAMQVFNNLKVILEENGKEDSSKGARRRLVMKYLERESITWKDGEVKGTILIPLDI